MSSESLKENIHPNFTFRLAARNEKMHALAVIFDDNSGNGQSYARHFVTNAAKEGSSLEWIFIAVDENNHIAHALLAIPRPGRTGVIFLSKPKLRKDITPSSQLIKFALSQLPDADFNLMQAIIEPDESLYTLAYRGADFDPMAVLSYMRLTLFKEPEVSMLPEGYRITAYSEDRKAKLAHVLEQSYIDTLDCPQLRGLRSTDEIIDSHKAAGAFDPANWLILEHNEKPVGCLLLNRIPDYQCAELVYLGLAPKARGKGLANALITSALAHCWALDEKIITLAVDENNSPALHLYQKHGFFNVARKLALLRTLKLTSNNS